MNTTEHDSLSPGALTQGRVEASLAGQQLDRYDMLELLGVGGMGAVYRARDRELDELVALKVIRSELAEQPAMLARFRHEVKLARRVTHRNVARTFELGISNGMMFYTMELIEGESLTRRLEQRGSLGIGEAVSIACALCDGLAAAHAADVIHRDIKPDNILIGSDGRVVLADFGVAVAGARATGELSGTPVYMAPEQASGKPATPAADVYALGVVVYEMLTGRRPFVGTLVEVLADKQTTERLVPLASDIPAELAEAVGRATARELRARFASATELRRAVEPWLRASQPVIQAPRAEEHNDLITIVVLAPVARPDDDKLYIAEAIHEELLARLTRLPRVRVLPRVGAVRDDHVIGVTPDILDGNLNVEITHRVGPPAKLVLPLGVDQITANADVIAASIQASVGRAREAPVSEAQRLLLLSRHLVQVDFTRVREAIAHLERARALAPDDLRITANLAIAQVRLAFFRPDLISDALGTAKQLAARAVAAAPDLADVQLAAGHIELMTGNPIAAARRFRIAISRAPLLAEAHEQLGRMLLEAGYLEDALHRLEDAIAINPNLRSARWEVARALALEERWDEHDRYIAELITLVDRPLSRTRYTWWRRDWKRLADMREQMTQQGTTMWPRLMQAVFAIFLDGEWPRETVVAAAMAPTPTTRRTTFISQMCIEAASFAGDGETALMLLERAVDFGLFDLHWLDRLQLLEPLRATPAFPQLRARVKDRADAILDALYGDQSAALSDTAIAMSSTT